MISSALNAVIRIGPLSIPSWALLILAGYLSGVIYLRIVYRGDSELRGMLQDRMSSAFIIVFLVWKLLPALLNIGLVIREPLYLLYATGGARGAIAGIVGGAVYLVISIYRASRGQKERRKSLVAGSIGFAGAVAAVFLAGMLIAAGAAPGSTRERRMEAPDFTLVSLTGEELSLSDFRGDTVILNFWATWCPPCRAEIPLFVEFDKSSEDTGAIVIGVNQTAGESSIEALWRFVTDNDIEYPVLLDPDNRIFTQYGIRGIPVTFVIGPEGNIIDRRFGVISPDWLSRYRD